MLSEMDTMIKNLIFDIQVLKKKIEELERNSHPKRKFVVCDKCKQLIKEKENG